MGKHLDECGPVESKDAGGAYIPFRQSARRDREAGLEGNVGFEGSGSYGGK